MRRWLIISGLWLVAVAAATTFHVPWERPHPTDPELSIRLGYAPLWSHRFAAIHAAHPDGFHVSLALFLALLLPVTLAADSLIEYRLGTRVGMPAASNANSRKEKPAENELRAKTSVNVLPFPAYPRSASLVAKSAQRPPSLPQPAPNTREAH